MLCLFKSSSLKHDLWVCQVVHMFLVFGFLDVYCLCDVKYLTLMDMQRLPEVVAKQFRNNLSRNSNVKYSKGSVFEKKIHANLICMGY